MERAASGTTQPDKCGDVYNWHVEDANMECGFAVQRLRLYSLMYARIGRQKLHYS
jgi:hypothetical protein